MTRPRTEGRFRLRAFNQFQQRTGHPAENVFFFASVFFKRFNLKIFFRCFSFSSGLHILPARRGCGAIKGASILEPPMTRCRRRKCRHCGQLYEPDPRNAYHQQYCSATACQEVSHKSSQRRWRRSRKGRDYFQGPANLYRVRKWRKIDSLVKTLGSE